MPTNDLALLWVTKSLLAITLFNLVFMLTGVMNNPDPVRGKYLVWTSEGSGELFWADKVQITKETVLFWSGVKVIKSYFISEFIQYNSVDIEPIENT